MKRVVSVLPSATEVLCVIGGEGLLVGRSHEDNYPASITDRPVLTGQVTNKEWTSAKEIDKQVSQFLKEGKSLYTLDEVLLEQLRPDVILTQDICAVCAIDLDTVHRVAKSIFPPPKVVSLDPQNLRDVLDDLELVGHAVGLHPESVEARAKFEARVRNAVARACSAMMSQPNYKRPTVAFIEWSDPIYVGGHWTPQLISMAGGQHPLNPVELPSDADVRSVANGEKDPLELWGWDNPETRASGKKVGAGKSFAVPSQSVVDCNPDHIIICCCGLKIDQTKKEADMLWGKSWFRDLRAVKNGNVHIVDGDAMFNRPGPRLVDALEWLVSVLHGIDEIRPKDFPVERFRPPSPSAGPDNAVATQKLKDIEDAHMSACAANKWTYKDPDTGYTVITELSHRKRGYCCGHRCRHCPYGHFNVLPENRLNSVKAPVYLSHRKDTIAARHDAGTTTEQETGGTDVLFWSGGKDSFLTYLHGSEEGRWNQGKENDGTKHRNVVLLTTFFEHSGMIQHQGIHHHEVMNQAKSLGLDLILAPLPQHNSIEEYLAAVESGIALCRKDGDLKCLFGDLHLADIRAWREQNSLHACEFPVFGKEYSALLDKLFTSEKVVSITVTASSVPEVTVGTPYTREFVASLPSHIDRMGENGEFHTYVKIRPTGTPAVVPK
ncbi:hypothetical protein DIPPA_23365 [Diplonema papillatum]|nr:hypothetical protein DIPPA_23365 [Diplonema papillatum]